MKSLSVATEWQINFYRCGALTLFVGLVILLRYRRSGLSVIRKSGKKGFFAGCLLSGAMLCNVVALKYTTVAVAVFVMAAAPVFAALLAKIILREQTHRRGWISIALAFIGDFKPAIFSSHTISQTVKIKRLALSVESTRKKLSLK